jgi:hypothetical protein
MKRILLLILSISFLQFFTNDAFAGGNRFPSGSSLSVSGGTVCLGQARTITNTITTGTCGSGGLTNIDYTVEWFFNGTTNTNVGGTSLGSNTQNTGTTATSINVLSPTVCGQTFYYYALVSWGAGAFCGVAGSVTTAQIAVTKITVPV